MAGSYRPRAARPERTPETEFGGAPVNTRQVMALSWKILAAHRLRTALCVASITLGVAAVVVMVALGRGAERRVLNTIQDMGTNLIVVNAGRITLVGGRERQAAIVTTLKTDDGDAIWDHAASVVEVAPETTRKMNVEWSDQNFMTDIVATTPAAFRIRNIEMESGRAFDDGDNETAQRVAVVGAIAAARLFGNQDPVGHRIRIGLAPFEIVGVMKAKWLDANGVDRDDRVLVPIRTAMRRLVWTTYIQKIHVRVAGPEHFQRAEMEIRDLLRERHRLRDRPDDFTIQNQATLVASARRSGRVHTRLAASVAAIALVVGGIGILGVMLTAGRERRREIGLRRALGARRRDIHLQFLLESLMLAGLGGLGGVAIGVVAVAVASTFSGWAVMQSWGATAGALFLAMTDGLVFGIYPASKASSLEPVEALRGD